MVATQGSASVVALLLATAALAPVAAGPFSDPNARGRLVRREGALQPEASRLQGLLQNALRRVPADRLFAVEDSVRPTYEAFPKNSVGKIPSHEVFAGIVRSYFAKEHGWMLDGLWPTALVSNATEVQGAKILVDRAPEIAAALGEAISSDRGASLSDVVRTIAVLENLVVKESEGILKAAYVLNEIKPENSVGDEELHEILESYLLLIRLGKNRNKTSIEGHRRAKEIARDSEGWSSLVAFEQEVVESAGYSSPYTFSEVALLVGDLARSYGKFQNGECIQMKETLMNLATDGSGTVKLEAFYAEPPHHAFSFTESRDYLKKIGALEENPSLDGGDDANDKRVRIANYLLGPSNCIAPSGYHVVCCLNECEGLISEIERRTGKLEVPAMELYEAVSSTPSATISAPRPLGDSLSEALYAMERAHGGTVPIHSADFKRWLHEAFPNECAVPTNSEGAAEDSEHEAAEAWMALQEECTRVPAWQTSVQALAASHAEDEGVVV